VLVLTIDPAKRLASALGLDEVPNQAVDIAGVPGLSAAMLDTSASWDDLVRRHAPDASTAARILENPLYRNITQRFVQSHDYVAMERLHDVVAQRAYDLVVVDTPPSRHALDFLDAPARMAEFFSSPLLRWITLPYRVGGERVGRLGYLASKPFYQVADRILGSAFLEDVAEFFLLFSTMYDGFVRRAEAVSEVLARPTTRFVVVTTPEPAPLREADFFLAELGTRSLHPGALVVNRLLPSPIVSPRVHALAQSVADGEPPGPLSGLEPQDAHVLELAGEAAVRMSALAADQRRALDRLAALPRAVATVPIDVGELTDLDGIGRLASHLLAPADLHPEPASERS
jgi:anion-transporting  ArsA/GET3 family ATPase